MAVRDDNGTTHSVNKRRSWTAYIPRPGSSSGRPSSSSSSSSINPGGHTSSRGGSSGGEGPGPSVLPRASSLVGSLGRRPGSSNGFRIKEIIVPLLATPQEGKELDVSLVAVPAAPQPFPTQTPGAAASPPVLRMPKRPSTSAGDTASSAPPLPPPLSPRPASRPSTPKRWSSSLLLTSSFSPKPPVQDLDHDTDRPVPAAIERTISKHTQSTPHEHRMSSGKSYLSSMMGGLSLSLSRTSTRDSANGNGFAAAHDDSSEREKDRGRSVFKSSKRTQSTSQAPSEADTPAASRSRSRARSQSPFFFRRNRQRERETSPTPQPLPLAQSETDLSDTASTIHPRNAFTDDQDSGDETIGETDYSDEDGDGVDDYLDPLTERNTEQNAVVNLVVHPDAAGGIDGEEPDPLGEGVNVVVPPEPYFPSSLNALGGSNPRNRRNPRRRKSLKHHEPPPLNTSRPVFQRDRCTITVTQGDPAAKLGDRRMRKYVVASDLSEESRYAVEWGIGTVLRDGDEMLLVTVVENESKVDPETPNAVDRTLKLRSQQERQGLAYILVRQVTSLIQRTKLNVTVTCQAWHAKNARHMLLDIVDYTGPTMLIVGSRGLGQLNGILLGSTSHYLIQKCSVPVMVARRRLKRPPKKSAHLSTHRQHVKLSEAGIDRVAAKVDQDVKVMWDEIQKEDNRRDGGPGSRDNRRGLVVGATDGPEELLEQEEEDEEAEASTENGEEDDPKLIKVTG